MHWGFANSVASKGMVPLPIYWLFTEEADNGSITRPDVEAKFAFEIDSKEIIL